MEMDMERLVLALQFWRMIELKKAELYFSNSILRQSILDIRNKI